jgi:hypothetical protein
MTWSCWTQFTSISYNYCISPRSTISNFWEKLFFNNFNKIKSLKAKMRSSTYEVMITKYFPWVLLKYTLWLTKLLSKNLDNNHALIFYLHVWRYYFKPYKDFKILHTMFSLPLTIKPSRPCFHYIYIFILKDLH